MKKPFQRARELLSKEGLKKLIASGKAKAIPFTLPKTFVSLYRRFVIRKTDVLLKSGLNKNQVAFVRQMSPYSYIGRMVNQTQILSVPARDKVLAFLRANREKIIDAFSESSKRTTPEAMHAFDNLIKGFSVQEEVKEGRYNEGVVERADEMLLGKVSSGKRVYVGRTALITLGAIEAQYVKSILGEKRFKEYAKKEQEAHDFVFGKDYKAILY